MSNDFPQTTQMLRWLERMQGGDHGAREEILHHVRGRLEQLTRKMLRDYPRVKRYEQPDAREGQAGPRGVTERFVVPSKPGNSGGGKGPQFKVNVRSGPEPVD
jgi:hypothetical protein